jgi:hypothetical protein
MVYSRGGQTFWIAGQISRKNIVGGRKKINETKIILVLAKKRLISHVYLRSYVLKLRSTLIKFSTRAAKNLWEPHAARGPHFGHVWSIVTPEYLPVTVCFGIFFIFIK